jgi:hypothetical protein
MENLLLDLSLKYKNLNKKYEKFTDYFYSILESNNLSMDSLFNILRLYNKNIDASLSFSNKRESILNRYSDFYQGCQEILSANTDPVAQQLALEKFILKYEKDFIYNLITNANTNKLIVYKLISRIYKHSTPKFIDRVKIFIENSIKNNNLLFDKYKTDITKFGDNLALALFIIVDNQDLINILFSKIIRIIGNGGGIDQTTLVTTLAHEMFVLFKHKSKDKFAYLSDLSDNKLEIINYVKDNLDNYLTIENKVKFGSLLYEFMMEEFDYIFKTTNIVEDNKNHTYVNITQEYLSILISSVYNNIKLPMICIPKI